MNKRKTTLNCIGLKFNYVPYVSKGSPNIHGIGCSNTLEQNMKVITMVEQTKEILEKIEEFRPDEHTVYLLNLKTPLAQGIIIFSKKNIFVTWKNFNVTETTPVTHMYVEEETAYIIENQITDIFNKKDAINLVFIEGPEMDTLAAFLSKYYSELKLNRTLFKIQDDQILKFS